MVLLLRPTSAVNENTDSTPSLPIRLRKRVIELGQQGG
ncbi:hypothetical protein PFLA_a2315 [Pseudoalteromonas flavipulchra NCIMB 2033 = ATCC BAA-314]|nr:hypothetical protein [Pseudoalteromonas flavipulchra NCIMB 2033 = ATCC BAA-314]